MKTKNSSTLAVGIDVHKKRHYARVKIREAREIISPILKIYNSKRGLDFLLEKVNHLMEKYQAKVLAKKPMQAVIAVADKFLRVCFYMLKNKTSFDPKRIGTGNLRTKAKFLNQSLEVSLDSKEIANLDLNLLEILSKGPKVVLFDKEDPREPILALLNAL